MFLFGKKKEKEISKATESEKIDKKELYEQALKKIEELEKTDNDAKVSLLNEIGSLFYMSEEYDQAILYYEQSLEMKKQMGKSYTDLLSLYNKKRQQAAEAKDDAQIKYYMDKVQNMMQMSKDMLRGKM